MIETVARALDPECFDAEVERVYGELWAFDRQAKARRNARAAIEAMREPTPEMVAAASRIPHASDVEIYGAMLVAALQGPTP